jgi:hypothetical protein
MLVTGNGPGASGLPELAICHPRPTPAGRFSGGDTLT